VHYSKTHSSDLDADIEEATGGWAATTAFVRQYTKLSADVWRKDKYLPFVVGWE
jgi:hypothetical protein